MAVHQVMLNHLLHSRIYDNLDILDLLNFYYSGMFRDGLEYYLKKQTNKFWSTISILYLDVDFLRRFINKIDWNIYTRSFSKRTRFENGSYRMCWNLIDAYPLIHERFMLQLEKRFCMREILAIKKKISLSSIPIEKRNNLTMDFLREFGHKLNWYLASCNMKFDTEMLSKFKENINWNVYCIYNRDITEDIVIKF